MTRERIEKPAPRETTEKGTQEKPKDLTPTGEQAKKSADETIEDIDDRSTEKLRE